jgi:hypothetical protein
VESVALGVAKTIVQKAAAAWIADRRTAEERKKELSALLRSGFRRASPEQRFVDEAAAELESFSDEFRGLGDGDREAALLAVRGAFERADLTDRALFAVDVDAGRLARRLRAGQPRAKTAAGLGEAGGAFYDAALDRCCQLYVRAVVQVPAFVGRSSAEILSRLSDLPGQVADRLSGLPDQVAARVINAQRETQAAVADPDGGITVAGRPLAEVTDPFDLEVHRPVQPDDAPPGLPVLPPYVPREHDEVLGQVVRAAAEGRSGITVLAGGSSTGKTRACWEALAPLRGQDPPWRLWHPIHPDAALRELPGIKPRTVVWLNEAQLYLKTADERGERVAAGLRELLRDPGRAPVLVLATLWPEYWHTLTACPAGGEDRHAQARELLAGHNITVPAAFTPAQMSQLARAADARMVLAARSAPDGAVIQFLAGAPELLDRYRNAPLPAARALMEAAMDARRLGMGPGLPQAFLKAAPAGYLTDAELNALGEDWLEQALACAAEDAKGVPGPLTRIRPRPASHAARGHGDHPASTTAAAGPGYRLADYLDQHGRAHRASQIPPAEFWSAAAAHAAPGEQAALGAAAHDRGLYRDAAQLHKNAAASGNPRAALYLSDPPACLRADPRPAHWAATHAALDDPYGVFRLLDRLLEAGANEQAAALLARDPALHAALDDPAAVVSLLDRLVEAGADEQAAALAAPAAGHAALDSPFVVARLVDRLRQVGADEQVAVLLARDPAGHAALDDPFAVADMLDALRRAGVDEQAAALAARAAAHAALDDPYAVAWLLAVLRRAGADEPVAVLLARDPAGHAALDNWFGGVGDLLNSLRWAGADEQAAALAARAAGHAGLGNPDGVAELLNSLVEAGAEEQVAVLLARDPAGHAALNNLDSVGDLLNSLRRAGADEQAAALAARAAAHAALDNPDVVARLLNSLVEAGAEEQAAALAARLPAVGMFGLFLEQNGPADRFRFGREADGTPAAPWGWEDLDLWLTPRL